MYVITAFVINKPNAGPPPHPPPHSSQEDTPSEMAVVFSSDQIIDESCIHWFMGLHECNIKHVLPVLHRSLGKSF